MNMEGKGREIVFLRLDNERSPFEDWLNGIKDLALVRAIDARITRIRDGNFGDHKSIGEGVFELRIPIGPGLRVYYGLDGEILVVLIGGGNKSTQERDIKQAKELWRQYKNEN